ncbi:hypothetical protein ABID77_003352 [Variovorax sp. PvP013]
MPKPRTGFPSMTMKADTVLFTATNQVQLADAVAALHIKVTPRHLGRKSWQVEQWAIHQLLQALPMRRYSFPVMLTRTERPDFILSLGGCTVGIEHTEAVSHVEAKIDVEQGKLSAASGELLVPRLLDARTPHDEPISRLDAQTYQGIGTPFVGDEYGQNWLAAMSHFVTLKVQKFAKYQSCDRRAVLVYDNWSLPGLETAECAPLLHGWLTASRTFSNVDEVFILRHDAVLDATRDSLEILPL